MTKFNENDIVAVLSIDDMTTEADRLTYHEEVNGDPSAGMFGKIIRVDDDEDDNLPYLVAFTNKDGDEYWMPECALRLVPTNIKVGDVLYLDPNAIDDESKVGKNPHFNSEGRMDSALRSGAQVTVTDVLNFPSDMIISGKVLLRVKFPDGSYWNVIPAWLRTDPAGTAQATVEPATDRDIPTAEQADEAPYGVVELPTSTFMGLDGEEVERILFGDMGMEAVAIAYPHPDSNGYTGMVIIGQDFLDSYEEAVDYLRSNYDRRLDRVSILGETIGESWGYGTVAAGGLGSAVASHGCSSGTKFSSSMARVTSYMERELPNIKRSMQEARETITLAALKKEEAAKAAAEDTFMVHAL